MTVAWKRTGLFTRSRSTGLALCLPLLLGHLRSVRADDGGPPDQAGEAGTIVDFPKRLAVIVVANEGVISTFEQRVRSWFHDGTEVHVRAVSEVDPHQLLASSRDEVSAWIVPLSPERAIVVFSVADGASKARHLVREVRLRSGLDDLGLERLASVVHAAYVALREGAEGFERAHAERELGEVGLAMASPPAAPEAPPSFVPSAPPANERPPARSVTTPSSLLVGIGYGGRLRGGEGAGHGPSIAVGLQLPTKRMPTELLLTAQYLVPSSFEANVFNATVQTTALGLQFGVEPELGRSFLGQALVGAGVDIAQIHSSVTPGANDTASAGARGAGTQWRSVGELTLGVLRRAEVFDIGLYAQVTFLVTDVHYSATSDQGDHRLVAPWPIEPGLSLQGRFRSAL